MPYTLNPFTAKLDYYENSFKGVLASAPADPSFGDTYIDSVDNGYYIFWGTWQVLATLTPPVALPPRFTSLWFVMPNIST